jgi:hypothetical protein
MAENCDICLFEDVCIALRWKEISETKWAWWLIMLWEAEILKFAPLRSALVMH